MIATSPRRSSGKLVYASPDKRTVVKLVSYKPVNAHGMSFSRWVYRVWHDTTLIQESPLLYRPTTKSGRGKGPTCLREAIRIAKRYEAPELSNLTFPQT